jgi:hypothetical protein
VLNILTFDDIDATKKDTDTDIDMDTYQILSDSD